MTQQTEVQWSEAEKTVAQAALKSAYDREVEALIQNIREKASLIETTEEVWQLHDYLSGRRHDIDGKYDDREDFLTFTLSRLVKEGLLALDDIKELSADKRAKVSILTRM